MQLLSKTPLEANPLKMYDLQRKRKGGGPSPSPLDEGGAAKVDIAGRDDPGASRSTSAETQLSRREPSEFGANVSKQTSPNLENLPY